MKEVPTPAITTIEKVSELLKIKPSQLLKTLIYKADNNIVAVLVRGDYDINETKVKNYLKAATLEFADEKTVQAMTGAPVGFSGPVGLKSARMLADESVKTMANFVVGANKKDAHLINVNMGRDFDVSEFGDFRVITAQDPCPSCGSPITIEHAIEIGHTFKLGTKYSNALDAKFLDKDGTQKPAIMGCYGIGVNRIVASLIESSNDKDGIIWPAAIAPYQVVMIAMAIDDERIRKTADDLYDQLTKSGYDVLYDDRLESPGKKFKDADLIGFPIQIVVSSRNLANDSVEIKVRETGKRHVIPTQEIESHLKNLI